MFCAQVPKASKPVAPAAVKTKSNPWSNTEDEFPTLEGASAKPHIHGWHFSKPQSKSSRPLISNHRPAFDSANDFPSLGMFVAHRPIYTEPIRHLPARGLYLIK